MSLWLDSSQLCHPMRAEQETGDRFSQWEREIDTNWVTWQNIWTHTHWGSRWFTLNSGRQRSHWRFHPWIHHSALWLVQVCLCVCSSDVLSCLFLCSWSCVCVEQSDTETITITKSFCVVLQKHEKYVSCGADSCCQGQQLLVNWPKAKTQVHVHSFTTSLLHYYTPSYVTLSEQHIHISHTY